MSVFSEEPAPSPGRLGTWGSAALALIVALVIVRLAAAGGVGAAVAFDHWARLSPPRAFAAGEMSALLTARLAASLLVFQCITLLLVFAAKDRLRPFRGALLRFALPQDGVRTILAATLTLLALAALYGGLVYTFDRPAFSHDVGPFVELMKSRTWWLLVLAAGVGAPIAEECLFRGLLYGVLRQTPVGILGATIVTALTWAMMHAHYSVYGLVAITLIGFYLAYLRERTGTLVTPIVCHGAYNTFIMLTLAFAPDGFLSIGP